MSTFKSSLAIGVLALLGLVSWPIAAPAAEQVAGESVTVPESRVIEEDLLAAGRTVQIQGRIDGDLAAAGADVTISRPVQGYVMAAGANVNVAGSVGNDLWAAGANVTVSAPVADNAMLAGSNVILQPAARVGRDARLAGASVQVQAPVGRNLKIAAANAQISAEIGGTVRAYTERLALLPGAVIRGDLVVHGPNEPEISPEAQVLGQVEYRRTEAARPERSFWNWLQGWLFWFFALLVLGAAIIAFSSFWADRVAEMLVRRPDVSLLTGLLGLVLVPILIVALCFTLIGIPLALLLGMIYGVVLLLASVFVAYWIGDWTLHRLDRPEASPFARMAVGALLLSFLTALPWIGWLFQLAVLVLGFGALVLERRDLLLRLRAEGLA